MINTIDWIKDKAREGWGFGVECKGKGRGYEMSYEALASKKTPEDLFGWGSAKHSVGDTFAECIGGLFGEETASDEEDKLLKDRMGEGWNLDIGFGMENGVFFVKGFAKTVNGWLALDDRQKYYRYSKGASLKEVIDKLFVNYDEKDPYVLAKKAELDELKKMLLKDN